MACLYCERSCDSTIHILTRLEQEQELLSRQALQARRYAVESYVELGLSLEAFLALLTHEVLDIGVDALDVRIQGGLEEQHLAAVLTRVTFLVGVVQPLVGSENREQKLEDNLVYQQYDILQ